MKKQCLLLLLSFTLSFAYAQRPFPTGLPTCLEDDFRELEKLYDATGGDTWTNKTNWFTSSNMATWYGIILTASGCDVVNITLFNNNLVGTLPNLSFPNIQIFYLHGNKLTGNIPTLTMPNLTSLALRSNQLTGNIPNFNMPNLTSLYLHSNLLTGSIPNFSMVNLRNLDFSSNQLSGTIPNFNLPALVTLGLGFNQLSGSIPNFNMPNLTSLYLYNNQLSGTIPSLSNTSLVAAPPIYRRLWLTNNKFVFSDFEGKPWLTAVDLRYDLQAKIPTTFDGTNLSVTTGSLNSVQQFSWYKNNVLVVTNQSNTYTPNAIGTYYCRISHNTLTTTSDTNRYLVLQSENIAITNCGLPCTSCNLSVAGHYFYVGGTAISLSWHPTTGALKYKLEYRPVGSSSWTSLETTQIYNELLPTALAYNTSYEWRVSAVCSDNVVGDPVSGNNFTTALAACSPTVLTLNYANSNTARFILKEVYGPGYQMFWKKATDAQWNEISTLTAFVTIEAQFLPNTQYVVRAKARCFNGSLTTFSNEVSFTTPNATCNNTSVSNLAITNITTSGATLNWTGIADATQYRVSYGSTSQTVTGTSATLTGLSSSTFNWVYVSPVCTGISSSSQTSFYTSGTSCPYPNRDINFVQVGVNSARIRWDKVGNAGLGYVISYRPYGTSTWQNTTALATASSIDLTGLLTGTLYEFLISSKCSSTTLSTAAPVSFTTSTASVLPVELLNVSATPLSKIVQLNWQTASEKDASYFDIERSREGKIFSKIGEVKAIGQSVALLDYTFTDEMPFSGVNYYRLRQVDLDGKEKVSNIVSAISQNSTKLRTYPNPVSTILTIDTEATGNFQILNLLGQVLMNGTFSNRIDVSGLSEGAYILKIGTEQTRFIKQ